MQAGLERAASTANLSKATPQPVVRLIAQNRSRVTSQLLGQLG